MTFDLEWPFKVAWRSRMWNWPISFWWCEIDLWLPWNTDGKLTPEVQNLQWLDLGWPLRGNFKVTKVKMAHIISTAVPRPGVQIDKYVHHCPINKSAPWSLTLDDLEGVISRSRKWKSRTLIWRHDSAIPATAGLLVLFQTTTVHMTWLYWCNKVCAGG